MKIVLLPGLDGSGKFFGRSLAYFAKYGSVQVVQFPTNVEQSYTSLARWLEKNLPKAEPFVIVAESFSGPIAIDLAARKPVGLCGLIFAASFMRAPMGRASTMMASLAEWAKFAPLPPAFILRYYLLGDDAAEFAEPLRAYLKSCDKGVLVNRAKAALDCDVIKMFETIETPILSLIAKRDRLLPSLAAQWSQCGATEVVFIDAPHFLLQEGNADQIEVALKAFFRRAETCKSTT